MSVDKKEHGRLLAPFPIRRYVFLSPLCWLIYPSLLSSVRSERAISFLQIAALPKLPRRLVYTEARVSQMENDKRTQAGMHTLHKSKEGNCRPYKEEENTVITRGGGKLGATSQKAQLVNLAVAPGKQEITMTTKAGDDEANSYASQRVKRTKLKKEKKDVRRNCCCVDD